jgi:hypothetical protein
VSLAPEYQPDPISSTHSQPPPQSAASTNSRCFKAGQHLSSRTTQKPAKKPPHSGQHLRPQHERRRLAKTRRQNMSAPAEPNRDWQTTRSQLNPAATQGPPPRARGKNGSDSTTNANQEQRKSRAGPSEVTLGHKRCHITRHPGKSLLIQRPLKTLELSSPAHKDPKQGNAATSPTMH